MNGGDCPTHGEQPITALGATGCLLACGATGCTEDGFTHMRDTQLRPDVTGMTTPNLVREFAASRVWFALHETHGRTVEGNSRHHRHCGVVDELRRRRILD